MVALYSNLYKQSGQAFDPQRCRDWYRRCSMQPANNGACFARPNVGMHIHKMHTRSVWLSLACHLCLPYMEAVSDAIIGIPGGMLCAAPPFRKASALPSLFHVPDAAG